MKLKEEEDSTEEEEEEMVVQYMDSDEEEKEKKKEIVEVKMNEEEGEEKEEEYILPPMEDWIPAEKAEHFSSLNFHYAVLPSSGAASSGTLVRSTIVGKFGRSVIIGPRPRVLKWEERHSSNTMMLVSPEQLRAYLHREAKKCNNQGRVTDLGLAYELQAAVTPWIGNLLIPAKTRLTVADILREQGQKTELSSTPFFLLFLQTMNVDKIGCKQMIEQRRNKVMLRSPPPDPSSVKNPKTIAGILQRRKMKEELYLQHTQILEQLQVLQQQEIKKRQQLLLKQQVRPQQLVLIQQPQPLPPHTTSPVSFAQAVVISAPVLQLQHPALNASPVPLPSTPHIPSVPPAPTALTESLTVQLCPHSTGATLPSTSSIPAVCASPANPAINPPEGREQMEADHKAVYSSQVDVDGSGMRALQNASEAEVSVVLRTLRDVFNSILLPVSLETEQCVT